MDNHKDPKDNWMCPNDRQLALRAKLQSGWSIKSGRSPRAAGAMNTKSSSLTDEEQEKIVQVIKKAESLELGEQERIGKLVERLENMKKNALGDGVHQCILCGDPFGLWSGPAHYVCRDCSRAVCQKCAIDVSRSSKEMAWLCRLCAETREIWKKSGAWFFKSFPKYKIPERKQEETSKYRSAKLLDSKRSPRPSPPIGKWAQKAVYGNSGRGQSEDDESSSSDDGVGRGVSKITTTVHDCSSESSPSLGSVLGALPTFRQTPSVGISTSLDSDISLSITSTKNLSGSRSLRASPQNSITDSDRGSSVATRSVSPYRLESQSTNESFSSDVTDSNPETSVTTLKPVQFQSAPKSPLQRSRAFFFRRESSSASEASTSSLQDVSAPTKQTLRGSPSPLAATPITDDYNPNIDTSYGQLEFSILYDEPNQALHCTILRARGLRAMDVNGLSDPYCLLQLSPGANKDSRTRTQPMRKTLNPEFNETLTYYGVSIYDVSRKTLRILVIDDDVFGDEPIGETKVVLNSLKPQQTKLYHVFLENPSVALRSLLDPGKDRGQIQISLRYSQDKGSLVVVIIRCRNLPPLDSNGLSDPFVRVHLKPSVRRSRKTKTAVKWKTLNPEFNEEFTFETKLSELAQQRLELTVWDKDFGKSNDYIGCLCLGLNAKGDRLRHWLDVLKLPDQNHEKWHQLSYHHLTDSS